MATLTIKDGRKAKRVFELLGPNRQLLPLAAAAPVGSHGTKPTLRSLNGRPLESHTVRQTQSFVTLESDILVDSMYW